MDIGIFKKFKVKKNLWLKNNSSFFQQSRRDKFVYAFAHKIHRALTPSSNIIFHVIDDGIFRLI